jgi:hypothetical protein
VKCDDCGAEIPPWEVTKFRDTERRYVYLPCSCKRPTWFGLEPNGTAIAIADDGPATVHDW